MVKKHAKPARKAPGAGKGTQARFVAEHFGIPHIAAYPFGGSAMVLWDTGIPAPPTTFPPRSSRRPPTRRRRNRRA